MCVWKLQVTEIQKKVAIGKLFDGENFMKELMWRKNTNNIYAFN